MNKTLELLNSFMTKVDKQRPQVPHKGAFHLFALYHPATGKVWLSKTTRPMTMVNKAKSVRKYPAKVLALPKDFAAHLIQTNDYEVDVYLGNPVALTNAKLSKAIAEDANISSLFVMKEHIKQTLWLIKHVPTGSYRLQRTSKVTQTGQSVLSLFMTTLDPQSVVHKAAGPRFKKFVKTYQLSHLSRSEFTIERLGDYADPRMVRVVMNDYVKIHGYDRCLNQTCISAIAKKTMQH